MKILVGLSGGVDSAVSAYLLKQAGHEVHAGFMINYSDPTNPHCPTRQDLRDAQAVAAFLGIPFHTFDFRDQYEQKILTYLYEGYKQGITPNPDVFCNNLIKFDTFLHAALDMGFDKIATGHYARIIESGKLKVEREDNICHVERKQMSLPFSSAEVETSLKLGHNSNNEHIIDPSTSSGGQMYNLLRGVDMNKDQSYFLAGLNQFQLSKALFPIGHLTKPEVREIAHSACLPNADRKDSQGLCFVGKVSIKEFLSTKISPRDGDILDTSGKKIGTHHGARYFTLGQNQGLGLNTKAYVVAIDVTRNIVIVTKDKEDPALYSKEIMVENWHWINDKWDKNRQVEASSSPKHRGCEERNDVEILGNASQTRQSKDPSIHSADSGQAPLRMTTPKSQIPISYKIRYRQEPKPGILHITQHATLITCKEPEWAVPPGQIAVVYDGDIVIGNGVITKKT